MTDVAVVGFAQAPIVVRDEHRIASEILYPQVRRALAECGVERDAIDYQVSASADYMDGRPFGFVAALDVMGSWPPRQDLHLEMDGSFATYYAWLRMQTGEVDTAIVCGHGKTSEGEPERVLEFRLFAAQAAHRLLEFAQLLEPPRPYHVFKLNRHRRCPSG